MKTCCFTLSYHPTGAGGAKMTCAIHCRECGITFARADFDFKIPHHGLDQWLEENQPALDQHRAALNTE